MRRSVRISAVHNAFANEPKTIHRINQTTPSSCSVRAWYRLTLHLSPNAKVSRNT